ncbi:DUF4007 family protein [Candidatus Synechococcus calcipolaris G9]|uniref:DUF4007 family protein n=1 Tax=Candidatus Synechococcus calcipolaris G9 TaxID=1497997 RepID=A0ABT6F2A7_9SYNE|nr:DUF4007 family protein [Candidatus Synechococcus calcipolaris]MDG2991979.1 DUF4007 family protein [Candidatus Synechococcus calcipolaris G9]
MNKARVPSLSVFARHETFHPRFGWLKKGFDGACRNPNIFLDDDATVQLGVGKNMVRSIRYWCNAFGLLEDDKPTEFGKALLGKWDPYLEDPASLWLLHWQLLQPPCYATAWSFVFNHFNKLEFTYGDLFHELGEYRDRTITRIADSSLKKDVSCILRMYTEQPTKASSGEESLDCPFTELRLIQLAGDTRHYVFHIGPKQNLPAEVIVYAALVFAHQMYPTARTIPVSNLLYDPGSPGVIFKINEAAICDAIDRVKHQFKELSWADAAGKLQFNFRTADICNLALDILKAYYDEHQGKAA